jgi:hypothetical protein
MYVGRVSGSWLMMRCGCRDLPESVRAMNCSPVTMRHEVTQVAGKYRGRADDLVFGYVHIMYVHIRTHLVLSTSAQPVESPRPLPLKISFQLRHVRLHC